jgi:hypothetical protein
VQKQKHEAEIRRSANREEKEKILLAIEDDKKMRAMVHETTKVLPAGAEGSSPRGSAGGAEAGGAGAGGAGAADAAAVAQ